MDNFQLLANAIVLQAAQDYREYRKYLTIFLNADYPSDDDFRKYRAARIEIPRLKRFFYSDWFSTLTSLNGPLLFERLEKECNRFS